MPNSAKYLFIVSMDVEPAKEALLNEVYDTEHIPEIRRVPGVKSVTRLTAEPCSLRMGEQMVDIEIGDTPKYTVIYEIDDPGVLTTAEWGRAVDKGRWATEVRPHTMNRRMELRKVMD